MNHKIDLSWVKLIEGPWAYADPFARYTEIVGLIIDEVNLINDDMVVIRFTDGSEITLSDEGQQCCETRYITCDDDLGATLRGGQLVAIDTDAGGSSEADVEADETNVWAESHDVQFVKVQTTKGGFTLCTHNEHNGYYGGFNLRIKRSIKAST